MIFTSLIIPLSENFLHELIFLLTFIEGFDILMQKHQMCVVCTFKKKQSASHLAALPARLTKELFLLMEHVYQ